MASKREEREANTGATDKHHQLKCWSLSWSKEMSKILSSSSFERESLVLFTSELAGLGDSLLMNESGGRVAGHFWPLVLGMLWLSYGYPLWGQGALGTSWRGLT